MVVLFCVTSTIPPVAGNSCSLPFASFTRIDPARSVVTSGMWPARIVSSPADPGQVTDTAFPSNTVDAISVMARGNGFIYIYITTLIRE